MPPLPEYTILPTSEYSVTLKLSDSEDCNFEEDDDEVYIHFPEGSNQLNNRNYSAEATDFVEETDRINLS